MGQANERSYDVTSTQEQIARLAFLDLQGTIGQLKGERLEERRGIMASLIEAGITEAKGKAFDFIGEDRLPNRELYIAYFDIT